MFLAGYIGQDKLWHIKGKTVLLHYIACVKKKKKIGRKVGIRKVERKGKEIERKNC